MVEKIEELKPGESLRCCLGCDTVFKVKENSRRRYCDKCLAEKIGKKERR